MSNRSWRSICFVALFLATPSKSPAAEAPTPSSANTGNRPAAFSLGPRDRVVLLGSTFIERDQAHGYLETALTARFHPFQIQFRNLGWSSDTAGPRALSAGELNELAVEVSAKIKMWLDATPLAPAGKGLSGGEKFSMDVRAGTHTFTILMEGESNEDLRLELVDERGSQAQVQIVGGK